MKKFKIINKKIYLISMILMLLLLCTGCTDRKEKQLEYRQKGITLMENGDYEEALVEFQNALDLSLGEIGEKELDICFYKAESLYRLGDVQGAMDQYSAIIAFNENAKAYFLRGNLYYHQKDEENALKDYEAAIEQDKKNYDLYIGVSEALTAHGKEKEAQEYLKQALEIRGKRAYDKMQKGRVNFLLGEQKTAISLLEEAIKGKELTAYYYLAEVYSLMDETKKAEETLNAYMEKGKPDSYNLFNIANEQIKKENYEMAIKCLDLALGLENVPNKQILMKTLVIAYEHNLDFDKAYETMKAYVENYPEDEEAKKELTFLETR